MRDGNLDGPITPAEACAVLGIDQVEADLLMAGPFAPTAGLLDIRQVLGCQVVLALPMLSGLDAVHIAITASAQAKTDEPARLLAVGWKHTKPVGCWLSGSVPTDLRNTLLVLPADLMLAELSARISAHRAAAQRPN